MNLFYLHQLRSNWTVLYCQLRMRNYGHFTHFLFYWYSVRGENVLKRGINKLLSVLATSLTTEAVVSYGGVD